MTVDDIMFGENFKEVYEELDDGWRHGNYTHRVYECKNSGKFYAINGQESGDGEFREYDAPFEVEPKVVQTTTYVKVVNKDQIEPYQWTELQ